LVLRVELLECLELILQVVRLLLLVCDTFGLCCRLLVFLGSEKVRIVSVHEEVVAFTGRSVVNLEVGVPDAHCLELGGLLGTQVALQR